MNEETKERIEKLLSKYERQFKWGGGENPDGTLGYGYIDFDELKKDIFNIIETEEKYL